MPKPIKYNGHSALSIKALHNPVQEDLTGHLVKILHSDTSLVREGEVGKVIGIFPVSPPVYRELSYCVEVWGHMPIGGLQKTQLYFTRNELHDLGIREITNQLKEV